MKKAAVIPPMPEEHFPSGSVVLNLSQPVGGYWDGGLKSRFEFSLQVVSGGYERHEDLPWHYKVGSYEANFWFRMPPCEKPLAKVKRLLPGKMGRDYRRLIQSIEIKP